MDNKKREAVKKAMEENASIKACLFANLGVLLFSIFMLFHLMFPKIKSLSLIANFLGLD
jgi:hypothetical protein